ncbi:MAG: hypothetical protein O2U61_01090 [Candidatus Bathyarchaeota archaeon]|nr:hypothetical protein [Candidatus Bathyarchaeota archaeon]
MRNLKQGVEAQGVINTIDLKKIMNQYTSSFTEGFLTVMEYYNNPIRESVDENKEVEKTQIQKTSSKPKNNGFDKLKNRLLREKLQSCSSVIFNPKLHVRISSLKYKSIYGLDSLSKKKWIDYFSKGNVYIDKDVTSSKISERILFDTSITKFFGMTENSNQ